jgi:ABC-type sugar transport system substrate-binding protein
LTNAEGKIVMAGLGGHPSESAAIERNKGFERALEENPDIAFKQLVPARWNQDEAQQKTEGLFRRYPDIGVIWAANDPMALGAMRAAQSIGRTPGKDFITGGVDWIGPALEAIRAGALHTSIGGHFMEGGWVMVLLYDYAHGRDFARDGGAARFSEMAGLRADNLDIYLDKFRNRDWDRVDFTKFSKVKNPELKTYDFGLDKILDQL